MNMVYDSETGNGIFKLNTDVFFQACSQKDSSNNKGNTPSDKRLWTGFHVQALLVFSHNASDYEVGGCVSTFVAGYVAFVVSCINFSLIQQPASPLLGCLTLTSAAIPLPLSFKSLLCFLTNLWLFYSARRPFRASRRSCSLRSLELGSVLSHGKSWSSSVTLLPKTVMSIALVTFWCFLVHSIHSDKFLFWTNCKREIVLAKKVHAHAHNMLAFIKIREGVTLSTIDVGQGNFLFWYLESYLRCHCSNCCHRHLDFLQSFGHTGLDTLKCFAVEMKLCV